MCVCVIQGRFVTHVDLQKPVSGGLGFSVVGLKSENRGELGIFIQEIQPGSVADWYVRINRSYHSEVSIRPIVWIEWRNSRRPFSGIQGPVFVQIFSSNKTFHGFKISQSLLTKCYSKRNIIKFVHFYLRSQRNLTKVVKIGKNKCQIFPVIV